MVIEKRNPCDGKILTKIPCATSSDVADTLKVARESKWAECTPIDRAEYLRAMCSKMLEKSSDLIVFIQKELGKTYDEAAAEVEASILLGHFFTGEGQRLYGRTTTSQSSGRWAMTFREPCGVAGLITAFNMPLANIAWKVFPALICGNAVILKPSEYAPLTAQYFVDLAQSILPIDVLNIIHGDYEAGEALLTRSPSPDVVSFTGSSDAGRHIGRKCVERGIKHSLEMGGKNAFVVCEDADTPNALRWAHLSVFSLAGQRCASASRLFIHEKVYDSFKEEMVKGIPRVLNPVISENSLARMLKIVESEIDHGAKVLIGGHRMKDQAHRDGYYMAPTLLENASRHIDSTELFGPIATLHKVGSLDEAIAKVNDSSYGLTAAIHTQNISKALEFVRKAKTGVVSVNAGTFGSEPHMPFGGLKDSGNGTREPGTEAIDVYSNLKTVYIST